MHSEKKPKILIIHHNDRDGYASAAIVYNAIANDHANIELSEQNYTKSCNDILNVSDAYTYEKIYIVDYSISTDEDATWLININKNTNVCWIDHHESSIDMEKKYPEILNISGIRLNGLSAAALCWYWSHVDHDLTKLLSLKRRNDSIIDPDSARSFLVKNHCPNIILYTHRYDIFDHSNDDMYPIYFNYGDRHNLKWWIEIINHSASYTDIIVDKEIEAGKIEYDKSIQYNLKYCDTYGFETSLSAAGKTYSVFAINKATGNSLLFGDIIDKYDIVSVFQYIGPDKCFRYSIYSSKNSDINVSKIAKEFGGGGHPHAAGFKSKELIYK